VIITIIVIQIKDEIYFGGLEKNKHDNKSHSGHGKNQHLYEKKETQLL